MIKKATTCQSKSKMQINILSEQDVNNILSLELIVTYVIKKQPQNLKKPFKEQDTNNILSLELIVTYVIKISHNMSIKEQDAN